MLTDKNFANALLKMNFTAQGNVYTKIFAENIIMKADLHSKRLFYPAQIKNRDRNSSFKDSNENLVVFECVNRLLDKGYKPQDIWLEKNWSLGHEKKSGRADICVSDNGKTIFIIECKTSGAEYNRELNNMLADGGQLFSYWQQEQNCQWLMLYTSDFDSDLKFYAKSVPCSQNLYRDAHTVEERFKIWSERYEKKFLGDVIFHDETRAYKIGVKPLRKHDLKNFSENKSVVNKFEEILRHNQVSDKENAFNRLIALFIAKLVDESHTPEDKEVDFQFKDGSDSHETFQDRLQKLYSDGMKKFMGEDIFYLPENYPDKLFANFQDEENHDKQINDLRENFRKLKFYTNNAFAFVEVQNDKLFYLNAKILREVVEILKDYKIIGSTDLQTLGDLFEQLLNKGFKQNEGQFFTPIDIAQFIWDSLPLEKIISNEPPKIIDYACGAGHFLTEGFKAVNDFYARKNLNPPLMWERDKLFGVEKDYRLARVSKISLFMHGANEGKIKFGDGLENYPDENISPATFDILVANPPYSVKSFKSHLKLANELEVLDKISNDGSEIETLFAERIGQLVKSRGVAAVILPSSILNKDGKSFIAARESLLKNFFIRAIVQLGSKTFGATGTNTVIMFLERFDEPPRRLADYEDVAATILEGRPLGRKFSREIFDGYLKKTGKTLETLTEDDRERIIYFGLTFKQMTLIISAPDDVKAQEKFLGYGWSNAKGREGIVHKKRGGFLFDNDNRAAENTLAAVIRAVFDEKQLKIAALEEYYHYSTLADMLDFDSSKFTKTIRTTPQRNVELKPGMMIYKLSSEDFDIKIGDRVISSEIIDDGEIPVYSANVFEEFGRINKRNITDFSKPSVIWGIDGDWMVNFIPANVPFYPTDHCGVLRLNTDKIIAEYLAFVLRVEGEFAKFSRANRASIQRIKNLRIQVPPIEIQKKIVAEFDSIAAQTAQAEENIQNLDADIKNKFSELFEGKNFPRERLGNFITQIRGVSYKPNDLQSTLNDESILLLRANNISGGEINHDDVQFVSREKVSAAQIIRKGDILMSASSGSLEHVGKTALCNEKIAGETFGAFCKVIRSIGTLPPEYISVYLSTKECREIIMRLAKGANINNLKNEHVDNLMIPLPPLELQEEFAMYVENCESMKKSARKRLEKLKSEREELVRKYFR